MANFIEDLGITGHLQIAKKHSNGDEEIIFDDHNVIVSGMGVTLSYLFAASGSLSILDYQIDRFQVGVSGPPAGGATSSLSELSGTITGDEYGANSNLFIETTTQIVNGADVANRAFALIPQSKVTRINENSVRYTITLDEDACNSLTTGENLNEIALFARNPTGATSNKPIMVAYRTFSNILKTSDFSLIFRWTINF